MPHVLSKTGLWVLVLLFFPCQPALAAHKVAHCRPLPSQAAFPSDFHILLDGEWGYPMGGWGGIAKGHPLQHRPVLFIHGNTRDASDWDEPGKSVKQRFLDAGYSRQELWAISYNGHSTKHLPPPSQCVTDARVNVPDVAAFVEAVVEYTGAPKVDIIAHSLGVVLARKMMAEHPQLSRLIERFVAIAGPNHGTTVCRRAWLIWLIGWKEFMGCDEIIPGSAWLRSLNGSRGEMEARGPTKYLAIYDGTGTDRFYLPWLFFLPIGDQDSPALQGTQNHTLPGLTHDELRFHSAATSLSLGFVQQNNASSP